MILLDTDHLSVLADSRDTKHPRLAARLAGVDEAIAIPIIAVEEQLRAWLARIHRTTSTHQQVPYYERLARLLDLLSEWEIKKWSDQAADKFVLLRTAKIRIGTPDLKIAALALVNDATLLSANLRDFRQVPDLRVEDWLYD